MQEHSWNVCILIVLQYYLCLRSTDRKKAANKSTKYMKEGIEQQLCYVHVYSPLYCKQFSPFLNLS